MRKYTAITLFAIVAIACLQGYYTLLQYESFAEEKLTEIDNIIRISVDKDLAIREHTRQECNKRNQNQHFVYSISLKNRDERNVENEVNLQPDTLDIDKLRKEGKVETQFDAMFLISMDMCEYFGFPLKLNMLDSVFTDKMKEKYEHTILLLDGKKHVIDSIGGSYDGWRASKDVCVSLKNPRYVRVMVKITPSDFIVKSVWSLSLSFLFAVIIIGVVAFQLTVIRRKEDLLSARELSINGTIHDLKSPLGGVVTLMSMLRINEKNEMRRDMIRKTEERTRQLITTIEMLLLTAGGTKRSIVLKKEPVDMAALTDRAKADVDVLFAEKAHEIVIDNHLAEGASVKVDKMYMENVMRNLIENAVKYADSGVKVKVTLVNDGSETIVTVEDNGWGIPRKCLRNVFKQFYRVPRKDSPKGFGIGLALVKYIVEQHGGHVSLNSVEGQGSCFRLAIPN